MKKDVRWEQRFDNYLSALSQLENAVLLSRTRDLTELEKQGLIQAFEFTHELAWNLLKDYLSYQGLTGLIGSRDTSREAFQKNLIEHGDPWMEMSQSRNLTSHTYNKKISNSIVSATIQKYYPCFLQLKNKMQSLKTKTWYPKTFVA